MRETLARLRKVAAEHGDTGSAEARDTSMMAFLNELEAVVCAQVIHLLPDAQLRALYVRWTQQLIAGLDEPSRYNWLAEGVIISPAPQGRQLPEKQPQGNVTSLHARHRQ